MQVQFGSTKMIDKLAGLNAMLPSTGLQGLQGIQGSNPLQGGKKVEGGSFADVIGQVLDSASASASKADNLTQRLQMDDPNVSLEETVIAMNVSSLQFTGLIQARNKVMQAYNDIMNMPV